MDPYAGKLLVLFIVLIVAGFIAAVRERAIRRAKRTAIGRGTQQSLMGR